jgi:hypothetical protein
VIDLCRADAAASESAAAPRASQQFAPQESAVHEEPQSRQYGANAMMRVSDISDEDAPPAHPPPTSQQQQQQQRPTQAQTQAQSKQATLKVTAENVADTMLDEMRVAAQNEKQFELEQQQQQQQLLLQQQREQQQREQQQREQQQREQQQREQQQREQQQREQQQREQQQREQQQKLQQQQQQQTTKTDAPTATGTPKPAPPFPSVLDTSYLQAPWYFAQMNRAQAEGRLSKAPVRSFVVRPSSMAGCLSLSHSEPGGQVGHGIIHCWDVPDRRGFSIESAPETYLTVEHMLLSLPLRHEDYGIDPNNATKPVLVYGKTQPTSQQQQQPQSNATQQQTQPSAVENDSRLAAKLAQKLDAKQPTPAPVAQPEAQLTSAPSVALSQLPRDEDVMSTPSRTTSAAVVSALNILDTLSDDDDDEDDAPQPQRSAPSQPNIQQPQQVTKPVAKPTSPPAKPAPVQVSKPQPSSEDVNLALSLLDELAAEEEMMEQQQKQQQQLQQQQQQQAQPRGRPRGHTDAVNKALAVIDNLDSSDEEDNAPAPTRAAPAGPYVKMTQPLGDDGDDVDDVRAPDVTAPADKVANALDVLNQLSDDDDEDNNGDANIGADDARVNEALNVLDNLSDDDEEEEAAVVDEPPPSNDEHVQRALNVLDTLSDSDGENNDDAAGGEGDERVQNALNVLDQLSDEDEEPPVDDEMQRAEDEAALAAAHAMARVAAEREYAALMSNQEAEEEAAREEARRLADEERPEYDERYEADDAEQPAADDADVAAAEEEQQRWQEEEDARLAAEEEEAVRRMEMQEQAEYEQAEHAQWAAEHPDEQYGNEYGELQKSDVIVGEEYGDLVVVDEQVAQAEQHRSILTESSMTRQRVVEIDEARRRTAAELARVKHEQQEAARRRADEEEEATRAELARQMAEDEAAEEAEAEAALTGSKATRLQISEALGVLDDLSDDDEEDVEENDDDDDEDTPQPQRQAPVHPVVAAPPPVAVDHGKVERDCAAAVATLDRASLAVALARADRACLSIGADEDNVSGDTQRAIAQADALLRRTDVPPASRQALQSARNGLASKHAALKGAPAADEVALNVSLSNVRPPPAAPKAPPLPSSAPPGAPQSDAELASTVRRLTIVVRAHAEAARLEAASKRDEWLRATGAAGAPAAPAGGAPPVGVQMSQIVGAAARLRGGGGGGVPPRGPSPMLSAAAAAKQLKARAIGKSSDSSAAGAPPPPRSAPPQAARPWANDRDALQLAADKLEGSAAMQSGDESTVLALSGAQAALHEIAALDEEGDKASEAGALSSAALAPSRAELRRCFGHFLDATRPGDESKERGVSRANARMAMQAAGEPDDESAFDTCAEPVTFAVFESVVRRRAARRALVAIAGGASSVTLAQLRRYLPSTLHEFVATRVAQDDQVELPIDHVAQLLVQVQS